MKTVEIIRQEDRLVQAILDRLPAMKREQREMARNRINPYRPFHEVMPDGAWRDERCFVIGGGPSLEGFNFERLRGRGRIIVTNKSYLDVPFADIVFFMDGSKNTFYGLMESGRLAPGCKERWQEFRGHKVYLNIIGRRLEDVYSIRSLGRDGLSRSIKEGLYHGNNAGLGAVQLAICLRANPIYLLGIDGKFTDGKSHYHGGYEHNKMPETVFNSFVVEFEKLAERLKSTEHQVINLNPYSAVRCFPFQTIYEVLK